MDPQNLDDMRRFVTFMGKEGYKENLLDSKLMTEADLDRSAHERFAGGPLRILYLSALQPANKPIGFILANGEKIGEWIHWLPFIHFARTEGDQNEPALRIFEVYQDRPWTKDGVLMATPPGYSIFRPYSESDSRIVIDVGQFSHFPNPSRIRSTTLPTIPAKSSASAPRIRSSERGVFQKK